SPSCPPAARVVDPLGSSSDPLSPPDTKKAPFRGPLLFVSGGERGIRTPEARFRRLHTFQACSFNHSDTSPDPCRRRTAAAGARILAPAGAWDKRAARAGGRALDGHGTMPVLPEAPAERGLPMSYLVLAR